MNLLVVGSKSAPIGEYCVELVPYAQSGKPWLDLAFEIQKTVRLEEWEFDEDSVKAALLAYISQHYQKPALLRANIHIREDGPVELSLYLEIS